MKIAIIGAGSVGTNLGAGWNQAGHHIIYGLRELQGAKATELKAAHAYAEIATNAPAVARADAIVLTTPWDKTEAAVRECGDLSGKIVIDVTNPVLFEANELKLALGFDESGGEKVAQWAAGAHVFKTMNQIGCGLMNHPQLSGGAKAVMFVAGADEGKATVVQLVNDLGFEAVDIGALHYARLLEPYALLWIHLALNCGVGRDFAFGLLRK